MDERAETAGDPGVAAGRGADAEPNRDGGAVDAVVGGSGSESGTVADPRDKRASRRAILDEPTDYSKQPNRLSNVRWPLGEEPHHDVEGTDPDDPFVNIKLEVVEGADPDPDQKSLLNLNGPLIRMKCAHCGQQLRIGASKKNKEVLEEGGFSFKPYQIVAHMNDELAACVCPNGHVTQLRMDMAMRLRQHV